MESTVMLPRLLAALAVSLIIAALTSVIIGNERKSTWFKKSYKQSFFQRRGMLGEIFRFGHPCCWQGAVVMTVMLMAICLSIWVIFIKF